MATVKGKEEQKSSKEMQSQYFCPARACVEVRPPCWLGFHSSSGCQQTVLLKASTKSNPRKEAKESFELWPREAEYCKGLYHTTVKRRQQRKVWTESATQPMTIGEMFSFHALWSLLETPFFIFLLPLFPLSVVHIHHCRIISVPVTDEGYSKAVETFDSEETNFF